jgi:hypothetical protein
MLVDFAVKVARMGQAQIQALAFAHGWFPHQVGGLIGPSATENYTPWADMLERWANKVLKQVDELCSADAKRLLGRQAR